MRQSLRLFLHLRFPAEVSSTSRQISSPMSHLRRHNLNLLLIYLSSLKHRFVETSRVIEQTSRTKVFHILNRSEISKYQSFHVRLGNSKMNGRSRNREHFGFTRKELTVTVENIET